jgi:hypothetical protein
MTDTKDDTFDGGINARGMKAVSKEEADKNPTPDAPRLVVPTEEEAKEINERVLSDTDRCGDCKHFRLQEGQVELAHQEALTKEWFKALEHDSMWYGRLDLVGLCNYIDDHMTTAVSPAYIPRHIIDPSVLHIAAVKDASTKCPYFEKGGTFRRDMKVFMTDKRKDPGRNPD